MFKTDSAEEEEMINLILFVLLFLMVTFISSLLLHYLFNLSSSVSGFTGLSITFFATTFWLWKWFFVVIEPNCVIVLQNTLMDSGSSMKPNGEIDLLYIPHNQRACKKPLTVRWPWEKLVGKINLKDDKIQIPRKVAVRDKDGQLWDAEFTIILTPLPFGKSIIRYFLVSNEVADAFFSNYYMEQFAILFSKMSGEDAQSETNENSFRSRFSCLLGGETSVSEKERQFARFASVIITSIRPEKYRQEIGQLDKMIDAKFNAIDKLRKIVDPNTAAVIVSQASGESTGSIIIAGLPAGMQHFSGLLDNPKKGGK